MPDPRPKLDPEDLTGMASLKHWGEPPEQARQPGVGTDVIVDCGWGRLFFGQTFADVARLVELMRAEADGQRDVAFYVRDPHVILAAAPHALFLDPSHTFRLNFENAQLDERAHPAFTIRRAVGVDEATINCIYAARQMVPLRDGYLKHAKRPFEVSLLVAEDHVNGQIVGVVMGVDHVRAFNDSDNGSSLWSLAVDTQAKVPGIGQSLVCELAKSYQTAGRSFMDLSVMHDNSDAISLYEKLGFQQVPVYCIKKKNPVNERLFVGPELTETLNIYAQIIVDEARRRGIDVEIEDAETGLFLLTHGGRSISCRESLSDLTSAVAMSRCDDKTLTHRLLERAELKVPAQSIVESEEEALAFLARHGRIVVKPARGEQGHGVAVDLTKPDDVTRAFARAREIADAVVVEEFIAGEDLRIIVINNQVVAAAVRKPASIVGDGKHTVRELIESQSRRRAAATRGESNIPLDSETERCVTGAGHRMTDILRNGQTLTVRKTANLHTGGTIHDVTSKLNPALRDAAVVAARTLEIPVVGLDMIVASPERSQYVIIEANERPGLANHEPAPTAERFIDLLFPMTRQDVAN